MSVASTDIRQMLHASTPTLKNEFHAHGAHERDPSDETINQVQPGKKYKLSLATKF